MQDYIEYIGYLASGFVLLSFLMKQMMRLRVINIVGCGLFIWYGIMLNSVPIIITNAAIVLVNFYFIYQMKTKEK
jgi:hypothetical protein